MELTALVFLPAAAAVLILLLPQRYAKISKWIALAAAIAALVLSVVLFFSFEHGAGYQFVERYSWIQIAGFDIQYALGVDGLSLPLVVLTTFLTVAAVLVSFRINLRERAYFASLLVLAPSVLGVFTALDFLMFFLFW